MRGMAAFMRNIKFHRQILSKFTPLPLPLSNQVDGCHSCDIGACNACPAGTHRAEGGAVDVSQCLPCDEGRYPVEVSPKTGEGKKKRIRVKLDNLRTINI